MAAVEPIVAPVAERVLIRALIFPFAVLAGYFFAWGIAFCADAITRWIFGNITSAVGWIPYAGRVLERPISAIQQKMLSYFGGLEAHFERQMATRWHAFASMIEQRNANAVRGAIVVYHTAHHLATLWGNAATGGLLKEHAKPAKKAAAQAAQATKTAAHADKTAHAAISATAGAIAVPTPRTKVIVRTYPAGRLGTIVAGLEADVGHVIDWTIPRLRARERAAEGAIGRLWRRVRANERRIGIGVAVGLVVAALGRLGLGFLRCKGFRSAGKRVCGMNPDLLDSLLADTLLIAGTLSLVEFAHEMVGVTEVAVRPITTFWRAS